MGVSNQDLAKLLEKATTIAQEAQKTFGSLRPEQLNWKPGPDRWSVAQCFDHLLTSNRAYFPMLESILNGQKNQTIWERIPLFPKLWGRLLIKSLDPASTRKLKAPKNFEPSISNIDGAVIDDFVLQQGRLIEMMKAAEGLKLEEIVVTSPAVRFITYSLMDAFRIIVVHEQRHFQQAQRVMEESSFPE